MSSIINNTNRYLTALVFITSFGLVQNSHANINNIEDSEQQSKLALAAAIADVEHRLKQVKPNIRLSYVREKDDNEGTIQRYKFTPEGLSGGKWTAINTEITSNNTAEKTWENDALLSLDVFDFSKVKLKSATEQSWFFTSPTFIEMNVNSAETDQKKAAELNNVMQAEIEVSKQNPRFISYRIYALKSFKPEFMVKVSHFNLHNKLHEAWVNGPLITHTQIKDVEGSIGFLISIDDHTIAVNSDFEWVEVQ